MTEFTSRRLRAATCTTLLLASACADKEPLAPGADSPTPQFAAALLAGTSANLPELPRATVDTRLIAPTGKTITVNAGGNFQLAIDQALPGDVIKLQAGATFTGNFVLKAKTGTGWITIRTSASDASLPAPGTRIKPSYASVLPKILSPNVSGAITTAAGAHHYRLIGLEVGILPSLTTSYGIVRLGNSSQTASQVPNNIILDRVYVHGHSLAHTKRCVELNTASTAVIDSYLAACHGKGQDTQAILGWNGPGPFTIENNYLEGAGENIMFGGANPSISGLVPSDITIRRNHFYKPPSWKGVWSVKNLLELKSAQRLLIEGNIFDGSWVDGQVGFAILLKSVNPGSCSWCIVQDVTFRYNRIRNAANGINMLDKTGTVAGPLRRVHIANNVIDWINHGIYAGSGRLVQILGGVTDLIVDHNTMFTANGGSPIVFGNLPTAVRFVFRNNITMRGAWGMTGSGMGEGAKPLNYYAPGAIFAANAIVAANPAIYPTNNWYPTTMAGVGMVSYTGGNYTLSSTSPYLGKAVGGGNPGANVAAMESLTAGVK